MIFTRARPPNPIHPSLVGRIRTYAHNRLQNNGVTSSPFSDARTPNAFATFSRNPKLTFLNRLRPEGIGGATFLTTDLCHRGSWLLYFTFQSGPAIERQLTAKRRPDAWAFAWHDSPALRCKNSRQKCAPEVLQSYSLGIIPPTLSAETGKGRRFPDSTEARQTLPSFHLQISLSQSLAYPTMCAFRAENLFISRSMKGRLDARSPRGR
jgi:hypothetical protein